VKHLLPTLFAFLSDPKTEKHILNGTIYFMISSSVICKKIQQNTRFLCEFLQALSTTSVHKDEKIQTRLFYLFVYYAFSSYPRNVYQPIEKYQLPTFPRISDPQKQKIDGKLLRQAFRAQKDAELLEQTHKYFCSLIAPPSASDDVVSLHWRYQVMVSACFILISQRNALFDMLPGVLSWFIKSLTSDILVLQRFAFYFIGELMNTVVSYQQYQTPFPPPTDSEMKQLTAYKDEHSWLSCALDGTFSSFIDSNAYGCCLIQQLLAPEQQNQPAPTPSLLSSSGGDASQHSTTNDISGKISRACLTASAATTSMVDRGTARIESIVVQALSKQKFHDFCTYLSRRHESARHQRSNADNLVGILQGLSGVSRFWPFTVFFADRGGFYTSFGQFFRNLSFILLKNSHSEQLLIDEAAYRLRLSINDELTTSVSTHLNRGESTTTNMTSQSAKETLHDELVGVEMVSGLLKAAAHTKRFEEIWLRVFQQLVVPGYKKTTAALVSAWVCALRFAVTDLDPKRFESSPLLKIFFPQTLLPNGDSSALAQAKQLRWVGAFLEEFSCRTSLAQRRAYLQQIVDIFSHPYKQVRVEISQLIHVMFVSSSHQNLHLPTRRMLLEFINAFIARIDAKTKDTSVEGIKKLSCMRDTLLHWVITSLKSSYGTSTLKTFLPLLLCTIVRCHSDAEKDVRSGCGLACALIAQVSYAFQSPSKPTALLEKMLTSIGKVSRDSNWHVRVATLPILQIITFNHRFVLTPQLFDTIQKIIDFRLTDPHTEVRVVASSTYATFLQTRINLDENAPLEISTDEATINLATYVKRFKKLAATKLLKSRQIKAGDAETAKRALIRIRKRHAGVLGLAALVKTCPYTIPKWLPTVLELVGLHISDANPQIVESVKTTFSEFRRTHETLKSQKEKFTLAQYELVSELLVSNIDCYS